MILETKSDQDIGLKRHMGIWQLTAFGLNYMVPIAPAVVFGLILKDSGGTVALPYFLAFIAMMFIVNSYMLMAPVYPVAGSLYVYVSRGANPHLGFIAGWVLLLDYIFIPTATSLSAVSFFMQMVHIGSFYLWYILFIFIVGIISVLGINFVAKLGLLLLFVGEGVIFIGFIVWGYAIGWKSVGVGHLVSIEPFHFNSIAGLASATAISVLGYLGFDAITTMSEEAINPKRDIPKAILLSVIFGAITMVLTGYIGMLAIPDWQKFITNSQWLNTTLFYVTKITGGELFAVFYTIEFILAMAIFNVVATTACSRLLYGMGKDNVLPRAIFAKISRQFKSPYYNVIIIVALQLIVGLTLDLNKVAGLVNFGAIIGFVFLNCTVIYVYYTKKIEFAKNKPHFIKYVLFPVIGNIMLIWIISGMSWLTYTVGISWLIFGIVFGYIKSNRYKKLPPPLEL